MQSMTKEKVATFGLALCLGLSVTATLLTGCKGDQYSRSTGEYIDDKALAYRVSGALHDNAEYKFSSVDVKSFRGTIQLSGFVNTQEQKTRAGEIAKQVQGVQNVENNVTVKDNLSAK